MRRVLIPTILAENYEEFKEKLLFLNKYFAMVQIDCADGVFVKNKTFYDLEQIKKIRSKMNYDLHLMVSRPEEIVKNWMKFKKTKRIIIHYESFTQRKLELYDIIKLIKSQKIQIGLAINPNTTISKVLEFLPNIDLLLVMGVNPGWSGQKLISTVLEKVRAVRGHYPKLNIGLDGGVTLENYRLIKDAGVNVIYASSMIYQFKDSPAKLKNLIKKIKK